MLIQSYKATIYSAFLLAHLLAIQAFGDWTNTFAANGANLALADWNEDMSRDLIAELGGSQCERFLLPAQR